LLSVFGGSFDAITGKAKVDIATLMSMGIDLTSVDGFMETV